MQESTFSFTASDGVEISVYRWWPDGPSVAAVQIVHGMAEHAGRYARLAQALTESGYAVYACDLRGHGRTAKTPEELGTLGDHDGWRKCLDDLWQLNRRMAADLPGKPIFLLGHSMGSTLARSFMARHGDAFAGVTLCAASGKPDLLATSGRLVARLERLRLGPRGISRLLQSLSFDAFNKKFEPVRTRFDWLSRDAAEVDKYVADPLCGFPARVQLWVDLLDALASVVRRSSLAGIPRELPVYVIAGSDDPVSDGARALAPMLEQYREIGLKRVESKVYPGARHELFNETNREEVTRGFIAWLDAVRATHRR